MVVLCTGANTIIQGVPYPQSARYILFLITLLVATLAVVRLGDNFGNWLLSTPGRRGLLARRAWRRTYALTGLYLLGTLAAIGYLATGHLTVLALMVAAFSLSVPAFAMGEGGPLPRSVRWLSTALPPLAVAVVLASALMARPEPVYARYTVCLFTLVGVIAYPARST